MKVKELLELLKKADPETTIVVEGGDHSYYEARAWLITARHIPHDNFWSEDWEGELDPEEVRKSALFVG
jgi:hypothetical protein